MLTNKLRFAAGVAATLSLQVAFAEGAAAQSKTVILKSLDGFTQLQGELIEFENGTYTIQTGLGRLSIDALQVSCEGEACPQDEMFGAEFGIFGSNTIGDQLMPALVEGYAFSLDADLEREIGSVQNESVLRIKHSDGRDMALIDLRAHGSGTSFEGIAAGQASIGMSSRPARDGDIEKLAAVGINDLRDSPNEHVIALDGLIVIVHPDNPVRALSVADISEIFAGEITNWSELGGLDLDINVYARDDNSGTYDTFESLVMRPNGLEVGDEAERFEDNALLSDTVANDLGGVGFVGLAYERAARALDLRQDCGIVSKPTTFAMKTEEYPLSRRLFLYENPQNVPAHAKNLIDFALSDDAQPLIEDAGYVSLSSESRPLSAEGERIVYTITSEEEFSLPLMREMLNELREADRLSVSFRFTPGSSRLDPQSLRAVERLAARIDAGDFVGRELILIGFTDSIGQFDLNRQLATRRAEGVLEEIAAATSSDALSRTPILVQGYGELTPVGCNDSFAGRFANRRVEVWVREPQ